MKLDEITPGASLTGLEPDLVCKVVAVTTIAENALQVVYTLCERKGWAEDARAYNEVVTGWSGIESAASAGGQEQTTMFN
jgi:adenine-specific DNA methylase